MSKRMAKLVVLVVLGLTSFMVKTTVSEAATITSTIRRGQQKSWWLNEGDTLIVYYYADGKSCTVVWWNRITTYMIWNPYTAMTIYTSGTGQSWYWMYNTGFFPYPQSLPLWLNKGQYKFYIKNYRGGGQGTGDVIYLKIQ